MTTGAAEQPAPEVGQLPPPPYRQRSLVVVPVGSLSRLTEEGISAALSLGDEVIAVTVCFTDPDDAPAGEELSARWKQWLPDIPLVTLRTPHRSLGPPIVDYLRGIETADPQRRVVVLIPEIAPARPWQDILYDHRGAVLDRAIRKGTDNVVICRLRFQLANWASPRPSAAGLAPGIVRCRGAHRPGSRS